MHLGQVYWITGISGTGKTTIGRLLYEHLHAQKPNVVFLDGDILREVFGNDLGYSKEDRLKSAYRNARLCQLLSDQGIDVVCATISLFSEVQQWNRKQIKNYKEIFLETPLEILAQRDTKQIYKNASSSNSEIVGIHFQGEKPEAPDISICNDGSATAKEIVAALIKMFSLENSKME